MKKLEKAGLQTRERKSQMIIVPPAALYAILSAQITKTQREFAKRLFVSNGKKVK